MFRPRARDKRPRGNRHEGHLWGSCLGLVTHEFVKGAAKEYSTLRRVQILAARAPTLRVAGSTLLATDWSIWASIFLYVNEQFFSDALPTLPV